MDGGAMSSAIRTAITSESTAMIPDMTTGIRHFAGRVPRLDYVFQFDDLLLLIANLHDQVWPESTDTCDTNSRLCRAIRRSDACVSR